MRLPAPAVLNLISTRVTYDLVQGIAPQDEDTLQAGLGQLVAAELLYSGDGRRGPAMCSMRGLPSFDTADLQEAKALLEELA